VVEKACYYPKTGIWDIENLRRITSSKQTSGPLTGQSQDLETLAASINHANGAGFWYFSSAAMGSLNENAEFGYSGASKRRFYALQKTSSSQKTPPVL
jgi:hypothetical protein